MKMLSSKLISERANEIRSIGHKNKIKYFKSIINNHKKVLIEGGNKGYTECYSKVQFSENILPGSLVDVKIISINNKNLVGILL